MATLHHVTPPHGKMIHGFVGCYLLSLTPTSGKKTEIDLLASDVVQRT